MAGIFDSIPVIVPILFVLGLAGVIAYEKFRSGDAEAAGGDGDGTSPPPARAGAGAGAGAAG